MVYHATIFYKPRKPKLVRGRVAPAEHICLNYLMLSKENIDRLKKRLEAAHADLKEQVASLAENPEFGTDVDHFEEEGEEAEEFSKNLGVADALKQRLKNVEGALDKMSAGTYGTCESCGGEITLEVLTVDPESRLCKECKEQSRSST